MSDPPHGALICDDPDYPKVCGCCQRQVSYVRTSYWHAPHMICLACFFVWYEFGIVDVPELRAKVLALEAAHQWPFPSDYHGVERVF
jgi:hypothetical protein